MSYYKEFTGAGDFTAMGAAESWLQSRGFSVGSTCRGHPRAILFGDYSIAKWRNLNGEEILALHGVMRGNHRGEMRLGPITVELFESAPPRAIAAFKEAA